MLRIGPAFLGLLLVGCASPAKAPPAAAGPSTPIAVGPVGPVLGITEPMPGEPTASELVASRLVPETCEETKVDVEPKLAEMRAAVDAAFEQWRTTQTECKPWRARPTTKGRQYAPPRSLQPVAEARAVGRDDSAPVKRKDGAAHSGTNNQVATVDEADIVKTDGNYMYLASNGALRIFDARHPKEVSVTRLPGTVRELFVEGDRAVVYASSGSTHRECTYAYDCEVAGDGSTTTVTVFDLGDRAKPAVVRKFDLSGSLLAARRTGTVVHTVVADGADQGPGYSTHPAEVAWCGGTEAKARVAFAKLKTENEARIRAHVSKLPTIAENGKPAAPMCAGLMRTALRDGAQFTSVVSFDLTGETPASTASVQSRAGTVFASDSGLYLAVTHRKNAGKGWYPYYASVDEVTDVHHFAIGKRPADTRYSGSGIVPGHVLNQFSMDEWNGYLRVATTKGKVPDPKVSSAISILAPTKSGALTRIGAVSDLAPGEDIRAVRFDDERAYVVTFKKTDPLFVIDTFEPQRPKVLGELKIPGFSTYLHRIDPTHLMSIGFDANDHGDFAYFDGVILQMFDVASPTEPQLLWKEKIGTRGSSSEAATNHLAFNWFAQEKLLAIPMTICEGGGDGRNGNSLAFSGLLVYDVDIAKGFTRRGGIDHGKAGASCGTWWSNANSAVKRSVFVDNLVYSIATDRMKVQRKNELGVDVADLRLDD